MPTTSAAERSTEYRSLQILLRSQAVRNPKRHALDKVRASVDRFGFTQPLLHDERTGRLVAGHGRLAVLRTMHAEGAPAPAGIMVDAEGGWLVPVTVGWASKDDAEADAYVIADNKLVELGGWDNALLGELLAELAENDEELLNATGYDLEALDALLDETLDGRTAGVLDDHDGGDHTAGNDNPREHGVPAAPALSLAERFGVPPFDVLDTRQGYWRTRKQMWLGVGFQSEVGRGEHLTFSEAGRSEPQFYDKKAAAEAQLGRALTSREFIDSGLYVPTANGGVASGTSVFDPVMAELAYRWFSPADGHVLDPFAGGSVRGVVAALCGRRYTGVELRADQVAANRTQAAEVLAPYLGAAAPRGQEQTVGDPASLTPVEEHGGYLVKRDDLFAIGGSRGGKVRSALALITAPGVQGVVTAGSRHSPQVNIVATIAAMHGLPCRVHVPSGAMTPELLAAEATGAEVVQHTPGYNSVIVARAREDAKERGWVEIPFGMECPTAVAQTRWQVANLPFGTYQRIVVPVGSGMSLSGVLHGLADVGQEHVQVVGVQVGADPSDRLDKYAPAGWRDRVQLVEAGLPYEKHAPVTRLGELDLDPVYEAKCLAHMQEGDLLWVVGRRETSGGGPAAPVSMPTWVQGDSAMVLPTFEPGSADLVFTCPPYYDLEVYSDDPADLSSLDYRAFDEVYARIIAEAARCLRPDRFAVFVTGDARDKHGHLHDLRGSTIRAAEAAGLHYVTGGVLINQVGSARIVAARQMLATRTLVRIHQDVLVFVKGDRKAAAQACGEIDLHIPEASPGEDLADA